MSKHHLPVDVAYRIYMRMIGLHILIDFNAFSGIYQSDIIKIQCSRICLAAYCHQNFIGEDGLFLSFAGICHGKLLKWLLIRYSYRHHLRLSEDVNSPFAEALSETFGEIGIEAWKDVLAVFDDRDLTAETLEYRCEFKTYDSASYDT